MPKKKETENEIEEMTEEEKEKLEEKLAKIGEFVKPKEEGEKEEAEKEILEGEEKKEEEKKEIPPEEIPKGADIQKIREKILKLLSEIGSKGLSEEEKKKFIEEFTYWDGVIYDLLDIGNNLQQLLGKTSINLTPTQAVLIYFASSGALILLLRQSYKKKAVKPEAKPEGQEVKPEAEIA